MDAKGKKQARLKIVHFFSEMKLHHIVFWLLLYVVLVILNSMDNATVWEAALTEMINVAFYAAIVYFNLLYLIPNYLTEKRFGYYGLLLFITAALITPIKILVYIFILRYDMETQSMLIANQFYIFLTHFVAAGTSTVTKILSEWLRHERDTKDLQTQNMQTELRFLKSQINPHFLFNTLNNLYALTLKKSDLAPEIVLKLSEIMRYMLYECNERRVPLEREVKYMRNYLDLEHLRQDRKVDISLKVIGDIKDKVIAPLMFIPFLENCFKHGLNNQTSDGHVYIMLEVEGNDLTFISKNSKAVENSNVEKKVGGIGLVNVRRRLNIIYPNQHKLQVENLPEEYSVILEIKLDT